MKKQISNQHSEEESVSYPLYPVTCIESGILKQVRQRMVMQILYSLHVGGSEMFALTLADNLDSRRFKSVICALDQGGALENEMNGRCIPFFVMDRQPGIDLSLMVKLFKLFRSNHVDVVHTHHFAQLFYSAAAARLAGTRLVHTEHDISLFGLRRRRIALRLLSCLCDKVVAVGDEVAQVLRKQVGISERKLTIIHAGIEIAAPASPRSEVRQELGIDEAERVVTIVARLSPEKNHFLLLEAFAEVVVGMERVRLLIVGEGPERDAISAEIVRLGLSEHVRMLGLRHDIDRILAATDVFALSSHHEGLPIAILEAMASAKPIVATAVGDIPKVVRNGETGLVVPPGRPSALSAALLEILRNDRRAAEMGAAARRFVEENYSLESMISGYERLYSER